MGVSGLSPGTQLYIEELFYCRFFLPCAFSYHLCDWPVRRELALLEIFFLSPDFHELWHACLSFTEVVAWPQWLCLHSDGLR